VVRQSIEEGVSVDENTAVDFDVSIGPEEEVSPSPDPGADITSPGPDPGGETQSPDPGNPDNTDSPDGPDVPVDSNVVNVRKNIALPQDRAVVNIRIVIANYEVVNRDINIAAEGGVYAADLTGFPSDTVDVYFDGILTYSEPLMK
jgi:hypothetical protein